MKNFKYFFVLLLAVAALASCGKKAEAPTNVNKYGKQVSEFASGLSASDTTAMLQLCDACMDLLKAGKIEDAVASLYEYDEATGTVSPLSEKLTATYSRKFKLYPVLDYQRKYFSVNSEGCNDVKYEITFGTDAEGNPEKSGLMFNPIKKDGAWYLAVKASGQKIDLSSR